jgi:type II secretory pathway pseudopilin PulG
MTLMEVLAVFVIIGILAVLLIPAISGIQARAQRAQCMANLRSLYTATELYLQQNGSWPQIQSDDSDENDQSFAAGWIAALKPFGPIEKSWICPTIQTLMQNPD